LFRFGWQPIQAERARLNTEISRHLALSRLAADAEDLRGGSAAPAPAQEAPLAQRVTRSAEAAGVALARIEPQGGRLSLSVQEAAFRDVLDWIVTLEREEAVQATALEIDRQTAPGVVSARLTVEAMR
ncbi:type II secretion system protein M, partial [Roseivivax sp. GX 12232]|uniref:type II secretion system protein GspM n=1 Tax=Roseivivax sp. GX 12232 TaxID=2900547 RepID=UPI001E420FAE